MMRVRASLGCSIDMREVHETQCFVCPRSDPDYKSMLWLDFKGHARATTVRTQDYAMEDWADLYIWVYSTIYYEPDQVIMLGDERAMLFAEGVFGDCAGQQRCPQARSIREGQGRLFNNLMQSYECSMKYKSIYEFNRKLHSHLIPTLPWGLRPLDLRPRCNQT